MSARQRLVLDLEAENDDHIVKLSEIESWIGDVKRHCDAADVDVTLYVGCLRVEQ